MRCVYGRHVPERAAETTRLISPVMDGAELSVFYLPPALLEGQGGGSGWSLQTKA